MGSRATALLWIHDTSFCRGADVIGFGLGALVTAALRSRPSPREAFEQRLRASLAQRGITLAAAELGRGLTAPVWVLVPDPC